MAITATQRVPLQMSKRFSSNSGSFRRDSHAPSVNIEIPVKEMNSHGGRSSITTFSGIVNHRVIAAVGSRKPSPRRPSKISGDSSDSEIKSRTNHSCPGIGSRSQVVNSFVGDAETTSPNDPVGSRFNRTSKWAAISQTPDQQR